MQNHPTSITAVLPVLAACLGLLVSCSSRKSGLLNIRQFELKSVKSAHREAKMLRGKQMFRLRGAVTMEERRHRLGQYYTVSWKNDRPGQGGMRVVMDYQQAATGSQILQMHRDLPSGKSAGQVELRITGEAYRVGGRVLAWRVKLLRRGEVIAEKRSYLWR